MEMIAGGDADDDTITKRGDDTVYGGTGNDLMQEIHLCGEAVVQVILVRFMVLMRRRSPRVSGKHRHQD